MSPTLYDKKLIADKIITWFEQHGRKNLPWQQPITPYRVWISEIMLQQTQVTTVIPYFKRFISHFPDISHLAQANIDKVLHLWTGLGYYARARNLHRAAQIISTKWRGQLPSSYEHLATLPGIGRTTAHAILSIAYQQATAILDGNVKRVLTRLHAISGPPTQTKVIKQLWHIAQSYMPSQRCGDYSQAIMDLGATLCTRAKPKCLQCPLQGHCQAHQQKRESEFPERKTKNNLPVRKATLLMLRNQHHEILLEKRPPVGIWGGLWSLPECPVHENALEWIQQTYRYIAGDQKTIASFRHTFTHFHLNITAILFEITDQKVCINDNKEILWYNARRPPIIGLAKPIKYLLINCLPKYNHQLTQ